MPNMPITNYESWGNLVISWARDESKRPKTVKELNQQMANANVGGSFSEQAFERVHFAQAPDDITIQLFLPTAKAIDRAIQHLKGGGRWMLPDFYSRDAFDNHPVNVKDQDKLKFLAERIGDYAIGQCG
jgi:hypothetical protein